MKILIIEEERHLALSIQKYLQRENYLCEIATSLDKGRDLIYDFDYECILLDISIYKIGGLTFLKQFKKYKKKEGLIVISTDSSLDAKINVLKSGADDYLVKPFHLAELSARIEAILRRKFFHGENEITFRNLKIDITGRTAYIDNKNINLTKTEFNILVFLLVNKGRVVSKSTLAEQISGQTSLRFNNFDLIYTHIKNLKHKLDLIGNNIQTIYATGYKFSDLEY